MKINIKGPEEYTVSQWAGGATTQLYIYPEHADYSRRDFIFRLSSATAECERSEFTSLPEVDRILMVLRGSLRLCFDGHGQQTLQPYEQASFDGGWKTTSYGRATDFNLMLREDSKGTLETWDLAPGQHTAVKNPAGSVLALYAAEGGCRLEGEGSQGALSTGWLAVTDDDGEIRLENSGDSLCRLVCARILL